MSESDEAQIRSIMTRFADAWNQHDAAAFAALFSADADFINVVGMWWRGRDEIATRTRANHQSIFKDSALTEITTRVRFLTPEVALTQTTWNLVGERDRSGQSLPTRKGIATMTLKKEEGTWSIAAFQNTNIIPIPQATAAS